MWTWYTFWLLLHIMGAVVAFGPIFTYPMVVAMARRQPQHGAFATQVIVNVSERYTIPGALSMLVSGFGLMAATDTSLGDNAWLVAALVLYAIALAFSLTRQVPAGKRMISLLGSGAAPAPGADGPPPEIAALRKTLAAGGALQTVLVVAVFVLMIWQPGR